MTRAGHSDFATTKLYVDLAGEQFRMEAELLERRLGMAAPNGATQRGAEPAEIH